MTNAYESGRRSSAHLCCDRRWEQRWKWLPENTFHIGRSDSPSSSVFLQLHRGSLTSIHPALSEGQTLIIHCVSLMKMDVGTKCHYLRKKTADCYFAEIMHVEHKELCQSVCHSETLSLDSFSAKRLILNSTWSHLSHEICSVRYQNKNKLNSQIRKRIKI